ncbi:MAG: lamin tail domain-containing protein [Pirellulales bacterium]
MRNKKVAATTKMSPRFEQLEPRTLLAGLADLRVSELMYNPIGVVENVDLEYVELLNTGVASLNLSSVHIKDAVVYTIPAGITLTPGGRIVLVHFDPNSALPAEQAKLQTFRDTYNVGAGVRLFGPYTGKLSNNGELVTLTDSANATLYSFLYGTTGAWPGRADGHGSSLEVVDPKGDQNDPDNWRSSTEYGGTPGAAGIGPKTDIVINEILAHTDLPQLDSIELYNTTGAEITIGGWYLSDSNAIYKKFQIPPGTTLASHGYVVYNENDFNKTPGVDPSFGLDAGVGEDLHLLAADGTDRLTRFVDKLTFPPLANGESFGRYPNATGDPTSLSALTLGGPNVYPRVGPVVIDQFMYHPQDLPGPVDNTEDEFIRIYNVTDGAITLSTWYDTNLNRIQEQGEVFPWKLSDAVAFDFPVNTVLPGHAAIYLVSFDPVTMPAKLTAFRTKYGLDSSSVVLGPWTGILSNGGEKIILNRPDAPNAPLLTIAPQLIVDEVNYKDSSPWPTAADGSGAYLGKMSAKKYGNEAVNWIAMTGPGVQVLGNQINGVAAQRSKIATLSIQFDKNVAASLDNTDLTLYNDTTKAAVPILITPTFDALTGTATWNLSDVPLADGYYTATLSGWGVTDSTGKRLDGDGNGVGGDNYTVSFFRLLGDTDGSASVDIFDVANVQTSYGKTSGATPAQGDFDGNGTVDIFDVALLQTSFGVVLAKPAGMPAAASAPDAAPDHVSVPMRFDPYTLNPELQVDPPILDNGTVALAPAAPADSLSVAVALSAPSAAPSALPMRRAALDAASVATILDQPVHRHTGDQPVRAVQAQVSRRVARRLVPWETAVDQVMNGQKADGQVPVAEKKQPKA